MQSKGQFTHVIIPYSQRTQSGLGLRSGLESFSALSGDTAGLVNVATQTSMAKMRLSQATSASIAANTLPVMYSVLLGMTIALFPVLIVLAVVSF